MAEAKKTDAAAHTVTQPEASPLAQITAAMGKTCDKPRQDELLTALVQTALRGTLTYQKSLTRTINDAISAIDALMSKQLAAVMHDPAFARLEGSWRGLQYLVMNSETGIDLQIKVLNVSKRDLFKDLDRATEFDQSTIFKHVYSSGYDTFGAAPFGALVGDYEFTNHPEDIDLLAKMSGVAAQAFCPFVTAAAPQLLGLDSYQDLSKPRDLAKIFQDVSYAKWRSFRESEDSRFAVLTMPRTLARLPYGKKTIQIDEFAFEEISPENEGRADHDHFCWMNTAYVFGARLTNSFALNGWCTSIRGVENGGVVDGLPSYTFTDTDGDKVQKCPTEIAITERREHELSTLGFLPLCHKKDKDLAVFFGSQTAQKPKQYSTAHATDNAAISARIPYIMAVSRIAHYLKCIARDKIGNFLEREDCERWLNDWIHDYVSADENPSAQTKRLKPLAAAEIRVEEVPGSPGAYNAVAFLRPWLQFETLTASLRMVARIVRKN